ncbi:putative transcriptional regulator, contains C-terminal CBS domains [Candidatus Nitrososphaera evergladensis SR1]|uniref:Putative transcriptional regulator, contains C-terminal CBS domains n=1 Tax=Candidatus Nitrososphaera evergladensis SR1 TaxID=1459636 RepID=A0A075N213_9ARCH|nr:CBS domain-containing protein [Candidatus Nitrososphaera evergladensis]AIF85489.1 putative transcriptional regulator, contains C-terminal CBS domains [Candidatus Nitrososphaera evergladensis SR1]
MIGETTKDILERTVKELMTKQVMTLEPYDNLLRAQNEMSRYRIKKIVIANSSGKIARKIPIGIMTVKDMLKFLLNDKTDRSLYEMKISEAMTVKLVTADADERVVNCARILKDNHNISSLVIVREDSGFSKETQSSASSRILSGIVTSTDLSRFYSENCVGLSSVGEYMSQPVVTISIDEKISTAAQLMVEKNISQLAVTSNDTAKSILGILSEKDISSVTLALKSKTQRSVSEYIGTIFASSKQNFKAFSEPSLVRIGDIFTPDPITIEKDADLAVAAKILTSHRVSALPVVDSLEGETKRNQPIGIISKTDVVTALSRI